ncbi:caspase family protein [Bradyrhizobium sp. DASA03068]|uniref:caspase family protein n=1 Tax=Bradyrhizobium sp. BLXBL-01 TaxID=3395915 RepID=UPI003F6F4CC7
MAELFFTPKEPVTGPQLHALIIGVDHYPYLGKAKAVARKLPALDNLHSPSVSARMLAQWLVDHETWLDGVKLGSVDLLVAPVPAQGAVAQAPSGHLEAIAAAFDTWYDRCNQSSENVAVFYFCGHGLQKDALLLLPENFGIFRNNPWMHAIDFDATFAGMSNCAARTQYFIIDACRQWPQSVVQDLNVSGVALGRADIWKQKRRYAPVLYGAATGLPAFGDTAGNASRLSRAVIDCLEGKAAVKENDKWLVSDERLGPIAKLIVEAGNDLLDNTDDHQIVDPTTGEASASKRTLVVLPKGIHPRAQVEFVCDPIEETEDGQFYHEGLDPKSDECRADRKGHWSVELLAGYYKCGVTITHAKEGDFFLPCETIMPPFRSVRVPVVRGDRG